MKREKEDGKSGNRRGKEREGIMNKEEEEEGRGMKVKERRKRTT